MNPIQQYMLSGPYDALCLEQSADTCMCLPAEMWAERNIIILDSNANEMDETDSPLLGNCLGTGIMLPVSTYNGLIQAKKIGYASNACTTGTIMGCAIGCSAISALLYGAISIVAAPLLCSGICLKSGAMLCDEKSAVYNQLAADHLNRLGPVENCSCLSPLAIEQEFPSLWLDKLNARKTNNDKQLKNIKNQLKSIENSSFGVSERTSTHSYSKDELLDLQTNALNISKNITEEIQKTQERLMALKTQKRESNKAQAEFRTKYKKLMQP